MKKITKLVQIRIESNLELMFLGAVGKKLQHFEAPEGVECWKPLTTVTSIATCHTCWPRQKWQHTDSWFLLQVRHCFGKFKFCSEVRLLTKLEN